MKESGKRGERDRAKEKRKRGEREEKEKRVIFHCENITYSSMKINRQKMYMVEVQGVQLNTSALMKCNSVRNNDYTSGVGLADRN